MDKNCEKHDEIEPEIPNSEELRKYMEAYRKKDLDQAPSTLWFFGGIIAIILLGLISIMLMGCQIMTEGCDMQVCHYLEKDHLENSTDSKSLLTIPKAI